MSGWRWFVPGRLEVFGKHTDYAGGRSLVAAVPRGITISGTSADDGTVSVTDTRVGETATFSTRGAGPTDGWRRYVAATIGRLSRNFPGANLSCEIQFESTLPRASGMSSSSALVIAIAEVLIARGRIEETNLWQTSIRAPEERAAYFACIENGAAFGTLDGDEGVGTHGGSEDHAAILTSHAGSLRQFSFSPLHLDREIPMPAGWTFAIAATGIRARKAGETRTAYNEAADAAAAIVSIWRQHHPRDVRSLAQLAREESLGALDLPAALRARLEHFVAEDALVVRAADAFARGDTAALGELADASQRAAAALLMNQLPETLDLVADARAEGAVAASGFGAGWGGSAWALVSDEGGEAFLKRWLRAYAARHAHLSPEGFLSPPSSGITRL